MVNCTTAPAPGATAKIRLQPPARQLPLVFQQPLEWRDAHWIALAPGSKVPVGPWRDHRPAYEVIRAHEADGGAVGVVPGSVGELVRLAVLDVDGGDVAILAAAYPPVAVAKTKRGYHCWYHSPGPGLANGQWAGPGQTFGDIRGINGYVRLWDREVVNVDDGLVEAPPASCPVPLHLVTEGAGRTGPGARQAAQQAAAATRRAAALLSRALVDATPVGIGAVVGGRHGALLRRVSMWGGRRQYNGVGVDDYFIALKCARYWAALPDRRTFPESEAAGILGWVLAQRPTWITDRVHTEAFLLAQQRRGRRGGRAGLGRARVASVRDDASNEAAQPWVDAGVSRAWWYRMRQRARTVTVD